MEICECGILCPITLASAPAGYDLEAGLPAWMVSGVVISCDHWIIHFMFPSSGIEPVERTVFSDSARISVISLWLLALLLEQELRKIISSDICFCHEYETAEIFHSPPLLPKILQQVVIFSH
jgi:hypothetical protein